MSRYDWPADTGTRSEAKDDAAARSGYNAGRRLLGVPDAAAREALRQGAASRPGTGANPGTAGRPRAPVNTDNFLWQPLGPALLLGGQAEGAPRVTGRINALAVHPDGQRAYAASANGGVWATTDGGAHWRSIGGLASTPVAGILRPAHRNACAALHVIWRDPPTPDPLGGPPIGNEIVFMGTGEPHRARQGHAGHGEDGLGIFVAESPLTNPADDPWRREAPHLTNDIVYALASSPDGSTVVAATGTGLYQRPAGAAAGAAWVRLGGTPFNTGGQVCTDLLWTAAEPDDGVTPAAQRRPARLWVWVEGGAQAGLWVRSSPTGNFSPVAMDMARSTYGYTVSRGVLASAPAADRLWLLIDRGGGNTGLFRISNPRPAAGAPAAISVQGLPDLFHGTGWYNLALAVDPSNPDRVAAAGNFLGTPGVDADRDLLTTPDGAERSFDAAIVLATVVPDPANALRFVYGTGPRSALMKGVGVHADVHALAFSHNGATLWSGNDGGVYRSDRPDSPAGFYARNGGFSISETNFLGASAVHEGDLMVGLQDNGVATRLSSSTWRVTVVADGGGVAREVHQPGNWMAQYTNGVWSGPAGYNTAGPLRRGGWFAQGESDDSQFYSLPDVIAHTRGGAVMSQMLFGTHRLWYTDDYGATWATLPSGSDAMKTVAGVPMWFNAQDSLGEAVVACRWQDADTAWVLTTGGVWRFTRTPGSHEGAGGAGVWGPAPPVKLLDKAAPPAPPGPTPPEGKPKKNDTPPVPTPGDPLSSLRASPTWTEIAPNPLPAVGSTPAAGALYLGTVGHPTVAGVETLWWFDGHGQWLPTELATKGQAGQPLPAPVTALLVDPAQPDEVWVGTTVGLIKGVRSAVASPAAGASPWRWDWTPLLNGLPEAPVEDLALYRDGSLRLLRAALGARGVWELRLDTPLVPRESYLRVHEGDLRHRGTARLLQADGTTERSWHASPDIRPRLKASTGLAGPGATPWTRSAPPANREHLRRFQAALRSSSTAIPNDPRLVGNARWDGYFSEVLREHGAPTVAVAAPPPTGAQPALPNFQQVQITQAFWNLHYKNAHRTAEPWGPGPATEADLHDFLPPLQEGAVGAAACELPARPWQIEVVVQQRGHPARDGGEVRVTLLWWADPAPRNKARYTDVATKPAGNVPWAAAVQAMLNSGNAASAPLTGGWHYAGTTAATRRQGLTGQLLDPLNPGIASFELNLTGMPRDRLVLLVAVVRAGEDIVLPALPLKDLVLQHKGVAVRAVRIV